MPEEKIRKIKICSKIFKTGHVFISIYGKALLYRIEDGYTEWILVKVQTKKNPNGEHVTIKDNWLCKFLKPQLDKLNITKRESKKMEEIKETVEKTFYKLEFMDKIAMLPIMDKVIQSVKNKKNVRISLKLESAEKICKILSNLGCRTLRGENYENITSCNSQKTNIIGINEK